jgi:trigger factor
MINDEFAKTLGLESLDKLKEAARERLVAEFAGATRQRVKRALLDRLDDSHKFEAPPSLIEEEFNLMWNSIKAEMESSGKTFADENTTEDEARAEYRRIAERRVRLGLVLAQIGEKADIKVSDDEVTQALVERVRQFPGQEKQVWEFYRKNPQAMAEIRAPLFEEKVVDHILTQVKVAEEPVSKEALFSDGEDDATKA